MKKRELQVLGELMRDSRKSDRVLAKKVGVSQPTVTRIRSKLEKEGYIKEYTLIPDFGKLGYELIAFTFLHFHEPLTDKEYSKVEEEARELAKEIPQTTLMIMSGTGFGFERVVVSVHENFTCLTRLLELIRRTSIRPIDDMKTFIATLGAGRHFQHPTFSMILEHLLKREN